MKYEFKTILCKKKNHKMNIQGKTLTSEEATRDKKFQIQFLHCKIHALFVNHLLPKGKLLMDILCTSYLQFSPAYYLSR